jgi:hypothetical protein
MIGRRLHPHRNFVGSPGRPFERGEGSARPSSYAPRVSRSSFSRSGDIEVQAMGTERDPYRVLGVTSSASQAEITRAYHRLLREHHPDTRTPDAYIPDPAVDEQLQLVLAAYSLLRDPERRAAHDKKAAESDARERRARQTVSRSADQTPVEQTRADEPAPIRAGVVFIGARSRGRGIGFTLRIGPVRRHR